MHQFSFCCFSSFLLSVLTRDAVHCPNCPEMTLVLISSLDQLFRPELVFNFQVAKFSFFMHTFLISSCVVFGSSTGPFGTGPAGMVAGCPCVSLGLGRLLCVFTPAGSRRPGPCRCFCGSRDLQVLAKCSDILCG